LRIQAAVVPEHWRLIVLPTSTTDNDYYHSDYRKLCCPVMQDVTGGGDFVFYGNCEDGYTFSIYALRYQDNRVKLPPWTILVRSGVGLSKQGVTHCSISANDLRVIPEEKKR
jgi:hypothetical protein